MDVEYVPNGETGKQCRDCKNFELVEETDAGKCFGKDVTAGGSCKFFTPKEV